MTARPARKTAEGLQLRVLGGRRVRRPALAPWMIMVLIGVVAFLGLGFARTSLDQSAFELAELDEEIAEQMALNQQLNLDIARLENPARIAPLAEEMGLVIPENPRQLVVDLTPIGPSVVDAGEVGRTQ